MSAQIGPAPLVIDDTDCQFEIGGRRFALKLLWMPPEAGSTAPGYGWVDLCERQADGAWKAVHTLDKFNADHTPGNIMKFGVLLWLRSSIAPALKTWLTSALKLGPWDVPTYPTLPDTEAAQELAREMRAALSVRLDGRTVVVDVAGADGAATVVTT